MDILITTYKTKRGYLGIESLSQESLRSFNKDYAGEEVEYAIEKIRNYGMEVHGLFVFGDYAFAKGDGLNVAEFAIQQKLSGVLIQPQIPFPGTKLYERLKKKAIFYTRTGRIITVRWFLRLKILPLLNYKRRFTRVTKKCIRFLGRSNYFCRLKRGSEVDS